MNWIAKVKLWWLIRSLYKDLDKEVASNINLWFNRDVAFTLQDDKEQKYFQGITNLKQEVKKRAKDGSLEQALKDLGDSLIELALKETEEQRQLRLLKESLYIRKEADIKSDKDKDEMINERISHYYSLQKKKEIRELNQKVRKAYRSGDMKQYEMLKKELEQKYGKL